MKVTVTVYGMGFSIKRETEEDEDLSVLEALKNAVSEEGMTFDPEVFRNLTYLVNGKRAYEEDLLHDGDSLTVLSILGGG